MKWVFLLKQRLSCSLREKYVAGRGFIISAIRCGSPKSVTKPSKFEVPPTSRIFENKRVNPNLFRITTSVSGIQLILWGYLSYFALTELKPIVKNDLDNELEENTASKEEDSVSDREKNLERVSNEKDSVEKEHSVLFKWFMSSKWRFSLSILSLGVGAVFALTAYIYPLRMVRSLTYVRPTQMLEVVTYTPWGSTRQIEVPLVDVVCNTSESQLAKGQSIALKIKDHSLYFLLNSGNTSIDPMLRTLVLSRKKMQ